jgi:hypothetical protein
LLSPDANIPRSNVANDAETMNLWVPVPLQREGKQTNTLLLHCSCEKVERTGVELIR